MLLLNRYHKLPDRKMYWYFFTDLFIYFAVVASPFFGVSKKLIRDFHKDCNSVIL